MDASSAQLDYGPRGITESVRSSVHYYNDDSDLDRLVEGVKEITWSRN
jgi:cysteine desulfurase / selenocysteine lyase